MEAILTKLVDQFIGGKLSRRALIQGIAAVTVVAGAPAIAAAAASARRETKAIAVNHISYQVKDYAKTRDFYVQNFGMKVSYDDGRQAYLTFGDTFLVVRQARDGQAAPLIDHIAYTIGGYGVDVPNFKSDSDGMGVELKARGLDAESDPHGLSWLLKDPDGYLVQVSPVLMKPGNPTFEKGMAASRSTTNVNERQK